MTACGWLAQLWVLVHLISSERENGLLDLLFIWFIVWLSYSESVTACCMCGGFPYTPPDQSCRRGPLGLSHGMFRFTERSSLAVHGVERETGVG